jgi:hypothetical protein
VSPDERIISLTDTPEESNVIRRDYKNGTLWFSGQQLIRYQTQLESRRLITTVAPVETRLDLNLIVTADIEALIVNRRKNVPWLAQWYSVIDGQVITRVYSFLD